MNAGDQAEAAESSGYLTEPEGHVAFVAALSAGLPQVHVAVHDLEQSLRQARHFVSRQDRGHARPERTAPADSLATARHRPAHASGDHAKPHDPLETEVGEAFKWVLGVEQIGLDDNFFELGGNSLLALDLVGRVRRDFKATILLRDFFSTPTVRGLAALADTGISHDDPVEGRADD